METFSFNTSSKLKEDNWFSALTKLEVHDSVFDKSEQN